MNFEQLPPHAQQQALRVFTAFLNNDFNNISISFQTQKVVFLANHNPRNNAQVQVTIKYTPNICNFEYDNVTFAQLPF